MRPRIIAMALLPGMVVAQSCREEAWRWCERRDMAIALDTQIAGCTWAIRSGAETTANLGNAFYDRGNARAAQGDRAGAIADYNEAMRLNPQYALALSSRGLLRQRLGQAEGARADIEAGIRAAAAGNGGPIAARAGLALLRGDSADLAEALRRDANNSLALGLRAVLRQRQGDAAGMAADAAAARLAIDWGFPQRPSGVGAALR